MKAQWLWLVGLIGFVGSVHAETLQVDSKIDQVVVFPDRALVTRVATTQVHPGMHLLTLMNLPPSIEPESLQVKGSGEADVTLFGAKLIRSELAKPQSEKLLSLMKQLQDLKNKKEEFEDQKTILKKKEKFLSSIEAASSQQVGKDLITKQPKVNDIVAISVYLDSEYKQLFQKKRFLNVELQELNEKVNQVQRELKKLHTKRAKQKSDIVIEFEAATKGEFSFSVSYRARGAFWNPTYEVRAESDSPEILFKSYGVVHQNTGENWEDVTLFLSTARPSVDGRMPELEPWFLRKEEVFYGRGEGRMQFAAMKDMAVLEMAQRPRKLRAKRAQACLQEKGPSLLFKLPKKETILSDNQKKKVLLSNTTLPAEFVYKVSPKISPNVFLTAGVENKSKNLFLAGNVNVFFNGSFVGKSFIDVVAPQEKFKLSLGIDEQIKVEQKQLSRKEDVSILSGFHGKTKTIDFKFLTTLENFHSFPIKLILVDQIPASDHDEIKIKEVEFSIAPSKEIEDKPGVKHWAFSLAPNQKQQLTQTFRVSHPASYRVEGL